MRTRTKSLGSMAGVATQGQQLIHAALFGVGTDFSVQLGTVVTDLGHIAQHQHLAAFQLCKHINGSTYRIRVGVVGVINQLVTGRQLLGLHTARNRTEAFQTLHNRAQRRASGMGTVTLRNSGTSDLSITSVFVPSRSVTRVGVSSISSLGDLYCQNLKTLDGWDEKTKQYREKLFRFRVRDKELSIQTHTESLSHTAIPKVALPRYEAWGDLLYWSLQENLPGEFPYTAGIYPFKREGEDPTRMFAGEGGPERTNRRFHYVSEEMDAKRLSTAFDSVTLYGQDPALPPDIYGKIGNAGVSIATLDDAKKLYSGFDLVNAMTSVSMTINGPAPTILAMYLNTAIAQHPEQSFQLTSRRNMVAVVTDGTAVLGLGNIGPAASMLKTVMMEEVIERLDLAMLKVVANRGAPGPDGLTVGALALTLKERPRGVFNVAGPQPVPLSVVIRETGRTNMPLSSARATRLSSPSTSRASRPCTWSSGRWPTRRSCSRSRTGSARQTSPQRCSVATAS